MPTYEYRCIECGAIQEIQHGMDQSPEVKCKEVFHLGEVEGNEHQPRECGGECERLISMPGIQVDGGASPSRPSKSRGGG